MLLGLTTKPINVFEQRPLPTLLFTYYSFQSKLFPFPKKNLARHNSIGMKDDEVGNKTRLDRKERKRKERKTAKKGKNWLMEMHFSLRFK